MSQRSIPELLAPAGSLDAVRAALANGADAVYLGAERFNARDSGAQLTLDEVAEACRLAHGRAARIYLTLNTLVKPGELADALELLGDAIDRGIDAAIVQDVGLIRLIQRVYAGFEVHGSTQMTVHDASGAAVLRALGVRRVVLARENTLADIHAIHTAVPELELESFVHGALCISYSGQCYMSGLISERSANRGSCAQSCRKDYTLSDSISGAVLDQGYLISARDLAAYQRLEEIADAGVRTLKIEGRKKRPEYVAAVTRRYRDLLDRLARGEPAVAEPDEVGELVQIFSRGFTPGMYDGRAGRGYVTRDRPDNRGVLLGRVASARRGELILALSEPLEPGDGVAFEPPRPSHADAAVGFSVTAVRTLSRHDGEIRQAVSTHVQVPAGWRVIRTSQAALVQRARESFAALRGSSALQRTRLDVRAFGAAGTPLKLLCTAGAHTVTVRSSAPLTPARAHALDQPRLRTQLGRLGDTPFVLGAIEDGGLASGLFLAMSELNHLRQHAVAELVRMVDLERDTGIAERHASIAQAIAGLGAAREVSGGRREVEPPLASRSVTLAADVHRVEDAHAAADAGATEISFDPFLRHPVPPRARVRALAAELRERGIAFRVRTPTIVRPEERAAFEPWLALDLPLLCGHVGLVAELAAEGRDVVADYAVNCFNQHTASEYRRMGATRIVLSIELTVREMADICAQQGGAGFDVLVYGRPEGMTLEHCVLSAAFDRTPTTCRDLCVQKHPRVDLTDPAGYTFAVATDAACRNRLLHSRPIEASEYLPSLWDAGVRGYRLLFNVPGDPVAAIVARYRAALDALVAHAPPPLQEIRALAGNRFTRGHFSRAV